MAINEKKSGIIISYITILASTLINFAYVPVLLGFMGKSEYGIYETMGSIIAYFSIMDFGLGSTITRFYTKYLTLKDERNMANVLAICSRIYAVITSIILVAGTILYFFLDDIYKDKWSQAELESGKRVYIVLLISISITIISQIYNAVISSHEKFTFIKVASLVQTLLQPVVVILVMMAHPTAFAMVVVMTISNILLVAAKIYYCYAKLNMKIKLYNFEKALLYSMLGFSFYLFLTALVDQIFWRSNQIILSSVAGTGAVAAYAPPFKIFTAYTMISSVIFSIFLPMVTSMVASNVNESEFSKLFIKAGRLQFIILFAIITGFILLGKEFLFLWLGRSELKDSINIMYFVTIALIAPFSIELIQNLGLVIMQARNKCKFRALVFLCTAIITISVAIPVAKKYGIIGCSIVTGCAFIINSGFIMNVYFKKIMDLDVKAFWIEIIKILIPGVVCCIFVGLLFRYISLSSIIIDFAIKCVIFAILYIAVMWLCVMNKYEKELFIGPIRKVGNKLIKRR